MNDFAISVENLGKMYRLGQFVGYGTLRDAVANAFTAPFRRQRSGNGGKEDKYTWALKNISFNVKPGEAVGIIGRNGAGKTTLLRILSRITEPTEGRAITRGRVRALLEVGTGFHGELTGRENVYLSGAILGMKRKEIKRKFDEIVAFSGVEKFIDTPLKRFSTGMGVRLAFSVAAHLEPDILLVDEVLAVGDVSFQKKCLGKMSDVAGEGRTVLFVSHNMYSVAKLCDRIILLDEGRLIEDGPASQVIGHYLSSGLGTQAAREWPDINRAPGNEVVRLRAVRVLSEDGRVSEAIDIRKPAFIQMEYDVLQAGCNLYPSAQVYNDQGVFILNSIDPDEEWNYRQRQAGRYISSVQIPGNLLAEGSYTIRIGIGSYSPPQKHVREWDAVAFQVVDPGEGDSARGGFIGDPGGVIRPKLHWETQFHDGDDRK